MGMGHDFTQAAELLESILDISNSWREKLDDGDMLKLLETNARRGRLFEEFIARNPDCLTDGSLKAVTEEIKANDKVVYMNLDSLLFDMMERLTKRRPRKKAAKPRSRRR
ncbi:MAG: hypothetical protein ACE5EI_06045 [Thermodesulfobacteriota bacterium]